MKKKKSALASTSLAKLQAALPENIDFNDPKLYINRELSMLEFQRRVLDEAKDIANPLLERVKFLSILGSNLEEFFMVRVGGLVMQRDEGVTGLSIDGLTAAEQLVEIRKVAQKLMDEGRELWNKTLVPELDKAGIHIRTYKNLGVRQKKMIDGYFQEMVYPVLTPLAIDPGHPFPHISNLSLNLAVLLEGKSGQPLFARIKVPDSLPQLVPVKPSSGGVRKDGTVPYHHYFVWLSDLIIANIATLFPGLKVLEVHPFHIIRNADMEIQELEAADLLEMMEDSVRRRRFGSVVQLTYLKDMPEALRLMLVSNLKVDPNDVYIIDNPLVLRSVMQIARIDRYKLKDRPFTPATPPELRFNEDSPNDAIFSAIGEKNILLHHPYDSFNPVIEFLRTAARDPDVLAIKQTLYRTGSNSPVVQTLLEARRDYGKQVAVLVELKARFDEESNIGWARLLEQEGVHVTYGLLGLKTHSKVALVVRKEGEHIRRYVHLGTGNYNHVTANIYEDLSLFTCDDEIGSDATDLFNYLTGYSLKTNYRKLLVAPINLRQRFEAMVLREIEQVRAGGSGHLIFKMNSLVDKPLIEMLYLASQQGVKIDLITRGICCLRPGLKGLSENIRVISVVGRFLEHSRIYYFSNGGNEEIYMGSADLMPRNLNQRVEVLFPVEDRGMVSHIRTKILEPYLQDNSSARIMNSDGTYTRRTPDKAKKVVNVQSLFLTRRKKVKQRHYREKKS